MMKFSAKQWILLTFLVKLSFPQIVLSPPRLDGPRSRLGTSEQAVPKPATILVAPTSPVPPQPAVVEGAPSANSALPASAAKPVPVEVKAEIPLQTDPQAPSDDENTTKAKALLAELLKNPEIKAHWEGATEQEKEATLAALREKVAASTPSVCTQNRANLLKNGVEALAVLFNAGLLGYELLATPPNLRATSDKVVLGVNAAALIAGGIPTIANLASCLKAEYDGHKAVAAQFNPGRAIGALNAGLKAIEGGCAIARGASKFKKGSYVGGFLTTASGLGSLVSGLFQIGKQIVSKTKLAKKSA